MRGKTIEGYPADKISFCARKTMDQRTFVNSYLCISCHVHKDIETIAYTS